MKSWDLHNTQTTEASYQKLGRASIKLHHLCWKLNDHLAQAAAY